jgi:hypothetical protein
MKTTTQCFLIFCLMLAAEKAEDQQETGAKN